MEMINPYNQIRLKIAAFLFNNRADALRSEMYQALCLHALSESEGKLSISQIIESIARSLGPDVKVTDSLCVVVNDAIQSLVKDELISSDNGNYSINEDIASLPDETGQQEMYRAIQGEIEQIARNILPSIKNADIRNLFDFYIEVTNYIAQIQLTFISSGKGVQSIDALEDEITESIDESIKKYNVDQIINFKSFIRHTLIKPHGILAEYLYKLIQVNVVAQLIAWDPQLENLMNSVLKGKTLYLDSSALFVLILTSHPLHQFFISLLKASHNDLGVNLKVSKYTIEEYKNVITYYDQRFKDEHSQLREISRVARKYNENPSDYLENSIFVDYVSLNLDHIDLGSWQRYKNSISGMMLDQILNELSINIDNNNIYIPEEKFWKIKDAITRGSKIQLRRGKRIYDKTEINVNHDAKIYYLIEQSRRIIGDKGNSLGYDTYLLTLDGSLVYFSKEQGIPWTETYFLFPNQWFEVTFPFLRLGSQDISGFIAGLSFITFSSAFPKLTQLIPLEMCEYVFEQGGSNLQLGTVRNVVERLFEERLILNIDPTKPNLREKEQAKLRVQRIIAEEELKQTGKLDKIEAEAVELQLDHEKLENNHKDLLADYEDKIKEKIELDNKITELSGNIQTLTSTYANLSSDISDKESKLGEFIDLEVRISELNRKHEEQINTLEKKHNSERSETSRKLEELNQKFNKFEQEKESNRQINIKAISATLMIFGLVISLWFLIKINSNLILIILNSILLSASLLMYTLDIKREYSFYIYGFGFITTILSIWYSVQSLDLITFLPIAIPIILWFLDRAYKEKEAK